MPKKRSKKHPLTQADKQKNKKLSSSRVLNENVIGCIKRFKIISDRYRNRRKRFGLRFNLISGIYSWELKVRILKEVYFSNYLLFTGKTKLFRNIREIQ